MGPDDAEDGPVDTGLVAATVTHVATVLPVPPAYAATRAPAPSARAPVPLDQQLPDGWNLHKVASLVSDVAQNMYELPYVLKKHALTAKQYEALEKNEFFRKALEAEVLAWSGVDSIQKRLALESALALEDAMPTVAARMSNKNESLGDIVMLMKLFAEIAGSIGSKAAAQGSVNTHKFKIIINLGGDTVARDATPSGPVIEHVE